MKQDVLRSIRVLGAIVLVAGAVSSCSLDQLIVRRVGDALAGAGGAGNVFTSDNDPELIAAALPVILKMYDALLDQDRENPELWLAASSGYVSYANAFLHTPATMLPPAAFEEQERMMARAKNLYLRGRDYGLQGLAVHDQRFSAPPDSTDFLHALESAGKELTALLYWTSAGWLGALSVDPFDLSLNVSRPFAARIVERALELDGDFDGGAIHEMLVSYWAAVPEDPAAGRERAHHHFQEAVRLAEGTRASPFVTYATAVALPQQKLDQFVSLMEEALAVDPAAAPDQKLVNTIRQDQARWFLRNLPRYFIEAGSGDDDWDDWDDWDEWDD